MLNEEITIDIELAPKKRNTLDTSIKYATPQLNKEEQNLIDSINKLQIFGSKLEQECIQLNNIINNEKTNENLIIFLHSEDKEERNKAFNELRNILTSYEIEHLITLMQTHANKTLIRNNINKIDFNNFTNLSFEGAGVRGLCFYGTILVFNHLGLLNNLENVAGTSAGAIMSMFLGLGYSSEELIEIFPKINFYKLMDSDFGVIRDLYRFFTEYGYYKGDYFLNIAKKYIAIKTGNPDITFSELHYFRELQLNFIRDIEKAISSFTLNRENLKHSSVEFDIECIKLKKSILKSKFSLSEINDILNNISNSIKTIEKLKPITNKNTKFDSELIYLISYISTNKEKIDAFHDIRKELKLALNNISIGNKNSAKKTKNALKKLDITIQKNKTWIKNTIDIMQGNIDKSFSNINKNNDQNILSEITKSIIEYKKSIFKDPFIVVVDVAAKNTITFCYNGTYKRNNKELKVGDSKLAEAVRASMSIPFVYKSLKIKIEDEIINTSDGGTICLDPISIFENEIDKTIGVRADTASEIELFEESSIQAKPINNIIDYTKATIDTLSSFNQQNIEYNNNNALKARSIRINTLGVSTIEFNISDKRKRDLIVSGVKETIEFLKKCNLSINEKELYTLIEKDLAKMFNSKAKEQLSNLSLYKISCEKELKTISSSTENNSIDNKNSPHKARNNKLNLK